MAKPSKRTSSGNDTVDKLAKAANLLGKKYSLIAFVPSANGLRVGGAVTVAGQLVGSVERIEFLPPLSGG